MNTHNNFSLTQEEINKLTKQETKTKYKKYFFGECLF